MDLPEEVENRLIDLFCNTKHSLTAIWNLVDPEHELMTFEEMYNFLVEYRTEEGKPLQRKHKRDYTGVEDKIFELRQKCYSYKEISDELKKLDIMINTTQISRICKKLFIERNAQEPGISRYEKLPEILEEELYNLRKQDMTYQEIELYYYKKGIKISTTSIRAKCKDIFEKRNEIEPNTKQCHSGLETDIYDERIFQLREQGLPYNRIREILNKEGIRVSTDILRERCKKVYNLKGIPEKTRCDINKRDDDFYNKVYELKNKGYTYKQMTEYFNSLGIRCSREKVRLISKMIFDEKGEKEPRGQMYKIKKEQKLDDLNDRLPDLYGMKKSGMTFGEITEYCKKEGINVSKEYITQRCNELFKEKGEKTAKWKSYYQRIIPDNEIYALRKKGMSYEEIAKYFNKKGISISYQTVRKRCKIIFFERKEKMPITKRKGRSRKEDQILKNYPSIKKIGDKKVLIDEMLKLGQKRKATEAQLKKFAEEVSKIYGEDINLNVKSQDHDKERSL